MIKIDIIGINEGKHSGNIEIPVADAEGLFEEFFGNIEVNYTIDKYHNRYQLDLNLKSHAALICDISAEKYNEEIIAALKITVIADTERFLMQKEKDDKNDTNLYIHEDENYIDVTQEVVEQLAVSLPMKRLSPEYRDKNFEEIYPEIAAETEKLDENDQIDERWSKLKNLKLN